MPSLEKWKKWLGSASPSEVGDAFWDFQDGRLDDLPLPPEEFRGVQLVDMGLGLASMAPIYTIPFECGARYIRCNMIALPWIECQSWQWVEPYTHTETKFRPVV